VPIWWRVINAPGCSTWGDRPVLENTTILN
jgi:hypothetical protein